MSHPAVSCSTGRYIGRQEESGVYSFRGIRYAAAPRFRPPVSVPMSSEEMDATAFGPTAIQSFLHSEPASGRKEMAEECLTVNVWTASLPGEKETEGRPVMFWIHGGSYGWGGTADPLYDCQYLAAGEGHPVVVSVEYRVNALGFSDLSLVAEGQKWKHKQFSQSGFLGLLDCQEALRWVRANIAAFGGDPENITVFGESAGGGLVSLLMVADGSFDEDGKCLFRRAIAQSGTVNLTSTPEGLREDGQILLILKALVRLGVFDGDPRIDGWSEEDLGERIRSLTLDDLMAVSGEDLRRALNAESGVVSIEGSSTVGGQNAFPLRCGEYTDEQGRTVSVHSIIPADPYAALGRAAKAGVELMIGTNGDEFRYWANDLGGRDLREEDSEGLRSRVALFADYLHEAYDALVARICDEGEDREAVGQAFFNEWRDCYHTSLSEGKTLCRDDGTFGEDPEVLWVHAELASQLAFRMPSVFFAESYLAAGGKVWMYYFDKKADMKKIGTLMGACHASEVAYVLNNLPHGEMYSGRVDPDLARRMSEMWFRFAASGVPACGDFTPLPYDLERRSTILFSDDGCIFNVSDPLSTSRELLAPWGGMYKLM